MKKENYFENVPLYGNLDLEEIIFEDGFPVFFTAKSSESQRFICLCCDVIKEQRWVIAPISNDNLIKLLTNKLSMYDSFLTDKNCIIARWTKENPILKYEIVASDDVDKNDLPVEGEYIDAEDEEYSEYIRMLEAKNKAFDFILNSSVIPILYKKSTTFKEKIVFLSPSIFSKNKPDNPKWCLYAEESLIKVV